MAEVCGKVTACWMQEATRRKSARPGPVGQGNARFEWSGQRTGSVTGKGCRLYRIVEILRPAKELPALSQVNDEHIVPVIGNRPGPQLSMPLLLTNSRLGLKRSKANL